MITKDFWNLWWRNFIVVPTRCYQIDSAQLSTSEIVVQDGQDVAHLKEGEYHTQHAASAHSEFKMGTFFTQYLHCRLSSVQSARCLPSFSSCRCYTEANTNVMPQEGVERCNILRAFLLALLTTGSWLDLETSTFFHQGQTEMMNDCKWMPIQRHFFRDVVSLFFLVELMLDWLFVVHLLIL